MDDVKDKMKGLMKKVNNPFSSSLSGKFKGQGRVLGSSSAPSQSSLLASNSKAPVVKVNNTNSEENLGSKKPEMKVSSNDYAESETGFDPFNSLITSGKRNPNGYSLKMFECPVCSQVYSSEEEVSAHVEFCLDSGGINGSQGSKDSEDPLVAFVNAYRSGKPKDGSIEVMMKVLKNIIAEPENVKFRKIRMGNPKIKEAIADVPGAVELLESVGFELREESGELWLMMEVPSQEQLDLIKNVILLLETKKAGDLPSAAASKTEEPVEPKKIDRQIRVFFSVPESVASKIELPDSFYNVSADEVRREAELRRKKLEESKLLIPKSYREKQAKAARKRYTKTVIRIQFPDGVVLQAVFRPSETTGTLYEFVSSALKQPSLEFELLPPVVTRRRVIPHFPPAGKKAATLEDEDLVPAALVKFKPIETDDMVFTGLCNSLLEISEPLISDSAVRPL